ncbi:sensor histidine kinase [Streptomyces colonosanans]|uniref:histidine kinase n=1 Tax=Streptomyces colonosanans TaxID=1428652 RepID=A0A1S2Q0N1_9ACTN|nr:nitrate- and nitrite sensing domain-containing protein [Streptomyces colonosanans]OIJ99678.1 histidine kinase [Streptomyces colonosanans]
MQKMRPRRTGRQTAPERDASSESAGSGRPAHVRNRLIIAVAVVAAAIAGAGAPSVIAASGQLKDSQNLVTLAEQTQDALVLAHSLADERDGVTSYVAAGRPKSKAPAEQQSVRVDRQIEDLRAHADLSAVLRKDLDDVATVRRAALTGKSSALETHREYSSIIGELHALAVDLAEKMPPRAGAGAHALAELDSAVQQSAAARGLFLAALNVPHVTQTTYNPITGLPTTTSVSSEADTKRRDALTAAAQQAAVRSDAAIAGFRDTVPQAAKNSYESTVTGPEVTSAEKYLTALADQPTLSDDELGYDPKKVEAALSSRVDLMRGVESSLYEARSKQLAQLRDDDVTALEIRIAVLGVLLLVAVGITMAMARTLTRPLAVLRLGSARVAADPAAEEPVKFTGRNDEFAQVVRSVNALHAHAAALQERLSTLEADRKHLVGQRQTMADEREKLRAELADASARLGQVRNNTCATFVNLALRTVGLVDRQLAVIEGMEEREQDPERLSTLFRLDHFATVMRRHSENLLVLAGAEQVQQHPGPVPLVDVVRAAVSEVERYERVRVGALPPRTYLAGFAADDLSHLVAELLENATSFSPPEAAVEVSGWLLENGELMLSVQDEGIGLSEDRMSRLNARLADFDPNAPYDHEDGEGLGLGLYVVACLAHRHGVRVELREQKQSGVAAVAVLPKSLLAATPTTAVPTAGPASAGAHTLSLPGADAEVNSNVLSTRVRITAQEPDSDEDSLIAAAEQALREHSDSAEEAGTDSAEEPEVAGAVTETSAETVAEPLAETVPEPEASPETTMVLFAPVTQDPDPADRADADHAPLEDAPPAPSTDADDAPVATPAEPAADPYRIGPDAHERAADEGAPQSVAEDPLPEESDTPQESATPRLTTKGLPKRTPKISAPAQAPRPRAGGVDAEALRRRLGGFHRGATAGYHHIETENAERTGETKAAPPRLTTPPHTAAPGAAQDGEAPGGTVEEASS